MEPAVEVFWGDEIQERSERDFLAQLRADLRANNLSATILANFYTASSSRQIDFIIITSNHVCYVELKNYTDVLIGGTNGLWSSRRADGTLQEIERQNPYSQALGCKMALSDDMHTLAAGDSSIPRPSGNAKFYTQFDGVVCIFPRLAAGSDVPSDYKISTRGYPEFFTFLTSPGRRPNWRPEHWESFIRDHSLINAAEPGTASLHHTAANALTSTYRQRFDEFYQRDLHELVPLPLTRDGAPMAAGDLGDAVRAARHVQLVGLSGCGKSHLIKHTLLRLDPAILPVLVEGGMYEGRLSTLIDRSVARFTTSNSQEFLRAAAVTGQSVLLVVDGYNECPEPLKENLVGDLSAFCLRTQGLTLLTSQFTIALPAGLTGIGINAGDLSEADRFAILNSYGATEILPFSEPFRTAYELSLAAECASEINGSITRGALFASFVRKQLDGTQAPAVVRDTLRQVALAMDERLTTWLPVDDVWRIGEEHLARQSGSIAVMDNVLASTITKTQQGRFAFSHELLGRFLTVEALRRDHGEPAVFARQLRLPRHSDLSQLAVELETDHGRVADLMMGLADWLVYVRALRAEAGQAARRAAQEAARQLLERVANGLETTTFTIQSEFEMTMTGGHELSEPDRALLTAIGALVPRGMFAIEVAGLLDATDAACQRSAEIQEQTEGRHPSA